MPQCLILPNLRENADNSERRKQALQPSSCPSLSGLASCLGHIRQHPRQLVTPSTVTVVYFFHSPFLFPSFLSLLFSFLLLTTYFFSYPLIFSVFPPLECAQFSLLMALWLKTEGLVWSQPRKTASKV